MGQLEESITSLIPSSIEGLSPVSLQEAIDKLDNYQNEARARLFRILLEASEQPGLGPLDEALSQLAELSDLLIADSPEAGLVPQIPIIRNIAEQITNLSAEISRQRASADLEQQVQEFEKHLAAGALSDAAWCCVRLHKLVQDAAGTLAQQQAVQASSSGEASTANVPADEAELLPADTDGVPVTLESVTLLQEAADRCDAKMKQALTALCSEALSVDAAGRTVQAKPTLASGVQLQELFAAYDVLGIKEQIMQDMAATLVRDALTPILTATCSIEVSPLEGGVGASLRWSPVAAGSSGQDPEHCCQALLRLLAQHLLAFDDELIPAFGSVFWRAMSNAYVELCARPFISANPEDLEGCEAKVAAAQDLESFAESLSFIDGAEPYLGPLVESFARHALSSRQESYLERARQLLLSQDWEAVVAGQPIQVDDAYYSRLTSGSLQDWEASDPPCGASIDGPMLAAGQYQVSRRMDSVVKLLQDVLQDACSSSRAVARALRSAISGITLLARSLQSVVAPEQLEVPQLGLTAYNDLRHLASMLLVLGQCYGAQLEAVAGEPVGFMEDAALLRVAARQLMQAQLHQQLAGLDELLAGLNKLRRLGRSDAKAGMAYRKAVQQLLHSMRRLGRTACEVLAPEDAVALAGAALNHVCGQLVGNVLDKSDIGSEECEELLTVLSPLVDEAVEAWVAAARTSTQQALSGVPADVVARAVLAAAHQLRKLQAVLKVVSAQAMADVEALWDSGSLQQAGVQPQELHHLLLAISSDTPARQAMLEKLEALMQ